MNITARKMLHAARGPVDKSVDNRLREGMPMALRDFQSNSIYLMGFACVGYVTHSRVAFRNALNCLWKFTKGYAATRRLRELRVAAADDPQKAALRYVCIGYVAHVAWIRSSSQSKDEGSRVGRKKMHDAKICE